MHRRRSNRGILPVAPNLLQHKSPRTRHVLRKNRADCMNRKTQHRQFFVAWTAVDFMYMWANPTKSIKSYKALQFLTTRAYQSSERIGLYGASRVLSPITLCRLQPLHLRIFFERCGGYCNQQTCQYCPSVLFMRKYTWSFRKEGLPGAGGCPPAFFL